MQKLVISTQFELIAISSLKLNPHNARTHTSNQIGKLAKDFREYGFNGAVLADDDGCLIGGEARLLAAKAAGMTQIPVIRVSHLTEVEKRGLALADNRIALDAGWDQDKLKAELEFLASVDFDLDDTGFDADEYDFMLNGKPDATRVDPADEVVAIDRNKMPVTRMGDLWILDNHRVLCADARARDSYQILMGNEFAQVMLTDPPFNVPIAGHVSGNGRIKHREFAQASGEMTKPEFKNFLRTFLAEGARFLKDGALAYVFMDWRHIEEVHEAGTAVFGALKNLIVWAKTSGGMGSFYRSQHELIFLFRNGKAPHKNHVRLGRNRYRTNVWTYAGVNTFKRDRMEELALHPTVKSIPLLSDAIQDCTSRNDIVLDPFGGSGTTLLAAERTGRRARLIEIDPAYVDVTIDRWQRLTGKHAIHGETRQTFADIAAGKFRRRLSYPAAGATSRGNHI